MKKTTVLALLGGATVAAGALGAVRESNRSFMGPWDFTMGSVTDALREANATTDDEIIACVLAYIRSRTENIDVRPAYYPVLKFGPASVLLRTRRPLCNMETVTLHHLPQVFEAIAESGWTLSDRAAHLIVLGTFDLVKEYADAQDKRNTAYDEAIHARLERLDPVFNAVGSVLDQLDRRKQRANRLTETVIRRIRKA